jgi:F-box protein 21
MDDEVPPAMAMAAATPHGLLSLPDELLRSVFEHVTALELAQLQQTCRRFQRIGADPLLWQSECLRVFRWWDKHHELDTKRFDPSYGEWKQLLATRYTSSRNVQRALSGLMSDETNRLDRIKDIMDLGYDAKDMLFSQWVDAESSEMFLAQK